MRPNVKLIACTKPVSGSGHTLSAPDTGNTLEEFIAFCARVSNPANQGSHASAGKLLQYLSRNAHWSPFEMAHAVLEITTTRDIARQILRHRSFSFQEFSQRYGAQTSFHPGRDLRWQDTVNRQNSLRPDMEDDDVRHVSGEWLDRQEAVVKLARENYEWALEQGVAKEVARSVLPEGLTMSKLYMAGTLRSWMHYIQLRTDPSTQLEHREIALLCAEAIRPIFRGIDHHVSGPSTENMIAEVQRAKQWVSTTKQISIETVRVEQHVRQNGESFVHLSIPNSSGGDTQEEWFIRVSENAAINRLLKWPF